MNSCFPSYKCPDHVKAEPVLGSEAKGDNGAAQPLGTHCVLGQLIEDQAFQLWGRGAGVGQGVQRKFLRGRGTRRT